MRGSFGSLAATAAATARRHAHRSMYSCRRDAFFAAASSATPSASSLSAVALRMRALQPFINAFTNTFDERKMEEIANTVPADSPHAAAASTANAAATVTAKSTAAASSSPPLLISVKDNFCLAGVPTTAASRMLESFVPHYDATAVEKLKRSNQQQRKVIFVGKTNMDEFGMGSDKSNASFTSSSHFGRVVNPLSFRNCRTIEEADAVLKDESQVLSAGGSSGGSAAALAAGLCHASIGSDTGGSIRLPAAYCGVLGLKPTYGRVSRFGLIAYASSMDTPSIMARDTKTLRQVLSMIEGIDPRDSTSMDLPPTAASSPFDDIASAFSPTARPAARRMLEGLTIGIPAEYDLAELSPAVRATWFRVAQLLQDEGGARVINVSLPHTRHALPAYYILAPAEAMSNLARYDGVRFGHSASKSEADTAAAASSALDPGPPSQSLQSYYTANRSAGFGSEVRRRILIGSFVLSSRAVDGFHHKAQRIRTAVSNDFESLFNPTLKQRGSGVTRVDLLLTPTAVGPSLSFSAIASASSSDGVSNYLNDVFTIPSNLAGLPSMSVPCGVDHSSGLPMAIQLLGDFNDEGRVADVACWIQQRMTSEAQAHDITPLSHSLLEQMERRQQQREQSGEDQERRMGYRGGNGASL